MKVIGPSFNLSEATSPKYSGKTRRFKFLCSIVDAITEISICESSQYDTLSSVINSFYLDVPSGERNIASKPDVLGQIGVPKLVDQILGKLFVNFDHNF